MKSPDTFVSFDLETTGLDPQTNEIIEIGAVRVEDGTIIDEFSEFVKPERTIPPFITALTGIRNEDVGNARSTGEVIESFLAFARDSDLVGQNVGFDMGFLRTYAGYVPTGQAIDNIDLARIMLPQLHSFSLDSLIEFFALKPGARHRALEDARLTALIFLALIDMLRLTPPGTVGELLKIAAGSDHAIKEIFEAVLQEYVAGRAPERHAAGVQLPPHLPRNQNIFGDFTGEGPPPEPGVPGINVSYVTSLLREDGALSRHHEGYEERSGQIALAEKIAAAFNNAEILLAEAGTGIGKSLAYLIPSILWAEKSRERVVISTNTKNLQEQLFNKDIPLLDKFIGFPFRAVILKGRGNYICLNRWRRLFSGPQHYLSKEERGLLVPIASWVNHTLTGDLSETGFFPLVVESGLLEKINSDSPLCLGARCPSRERCYVNRVRKAAQRSHIIIVNHSLVFSDMVSDGGVLGQYSRIVFDEAHNIEKVAMQFLGVTLSSYRVHRVLNRLHSTGKVSYGLLVVIDKWNRDMIKAWPAYAENTPTIEDAIDKIKHVRVSARELFEHLFSEVVAAAESSRTGHDGKLRFYKDCEVFYANRERIASFQAVLSTLIGALGDVMIIVSSASSSHLEAKEELMIQIEELQGDLQAIIDDIDFLVEASGQNVFWFEFNEEGSFYSLRIKSAPLDIAKRLAVGLYDHMETVIMTSATLAVARSFSYIIERLGLDLDTRDRIVEFIAASPFDYRTQTSIVVPLYLPSPKSDEFIDETNGVLFSLANEIGRGMLVLFTSRGHLLQSYHALRDQFLRSGIHLLAQGIDGSRNSILRRFREETGSVLFGTDSFWEGVDVPGSALEIVVIMRLPFAVPTDPVIQALMEEIERMGGNPFTGYSVPEAAIKLRQGVGRLIRHRTDRGAVVILDKRVSTARYGAIFRNSLPGTVCVVENPEILVGQVKNWFEKG